MATHLMNALEQTQPVADTQITTASTIFRWPSRGRITLRRRRRQPTVRLGEKKPRCGGFFLLRLFRRVRLRWLKMKLKKLKDYYHNLIKDIIEGGATMESYQQRLLMETSFGIPVMGVSFNSYPTYN